MATTSSELDKVFVAVHLRVGYGKKIFEWAVEYFDNRKNKIVLTNYDGQLNCSKREALDAATNYHLPICINKNFKETEILTCEVKRFDKTLLELMSRHGMKKLVTYDDEWTKRDISKFFTSNPDLSCKIWYVNTRSGQLTSTRDFGPNPDQISVFLAHEEHNNMEVLQPKEKEECVLHQQEIEQLKQKNKFFMDEVEQLKYKLQEANHNFLVAVKRVKEERDDALKEVAQLRKENKGMTNKSHFTTNSHFTLQEMEKATHNFSDSVVLGKGGYGCVYKGRLRGIDVAVKKLHSQNIQSIAAFKQEVDILTTIRHPYLVTLMGACPEVSAIVYEYLPNGSLEDHLNQRKNITPLTWQTRLRIIGEICLALIFLHSNKPYMVIHGDLKPDNVLLDANLVSKLCDFGISRFVQQSDTDAATALIITSNLAGTPGYMDPEFVISGQLTKKSDVYAFGVIILRLVTGKPAMGIARQVEAALQEKKFGEMIDASAGKWPLEQAEELANLGLKCSRRDRKDRPKLFNEVWPIVQRLQQNK